MKNIAFIFPGQGSQTMGMGKDFFKNNDIAKKMINDASNRLDVNFENLLFEKNDKLNLTQYTQPAILLISCISLQIFKSYCNINPKFVLGHSLGEFSALVASGAISYLNAIELVHKRGLFMQEACENINAGMMAIIGLDDQTVEKMCIDQQSNGKQIWPANYNMDGQIVVAGKKSDLESLVDTYKKTGAKRAIVLDMSVASHCKLLTSAVDKLSPYLNKFITEKFELDVISNVTAEVYNNKKDAVNLLKQQLISPVRYKQSILKHSKKINLFIEFGNGNVLKGINKKILQSVPTTNVFDTKSLEESLKIVNA